MDGYMDSIADIMRDREKGAASDGIGTYCITLLSTSQVVIARQQGRADRGEVGKKGLKQALKQSKNMV